SRAGCREGVCDACCSLGWHGEWRGSAPCIARRPPALDPAVAARGRAGWWRGLPSRPRETRSAGLQLVTGFDPAPGAFAGGWNIAFRAAQAPLRGQRLGRRAVCCDDLRRGALDHRGQSVLIITAT